MNQRQIEIFHTIMTAGTVSRAADLLRISQPAASKAIIELERNIGFALFERIKGRMVPTAEGQMLHREVEACFIGLSRLNSAAARIRDFGAGEIRIACLSAYSTTIAPLALAAFHRAYPEVAITMQTHMSSVVRDLVVAGQFDFGLAADEIDLSGVDARPFVTKCAMVGLPKGHPLCALESITPQDLDGQEFVALAAEDTTRQEADAILRAAGSTPRIVFETPYSSTVCAMIAAGIGCGFVNPLTAELYRGTQIELRPFVPAIHFRTLLLTAPQTRPSRIVKACIAAFEEVARQQTG
ncbi:LysR substrate-binding domain-containing protein [Pararhodobacter zhoushanensis]|uniref:LysR substrate-binding domain-containing protein n=1 Tax=Pararhodobacter zhoushanensis TaxID=2479545 RepID=A0ABT3GYT8_9RHOB|nr:LysR substrate-binding domain-containing protein [Pararhodobacter zhoushanensis]MCW1932691.1 LysR substrate-binding domain-containing protein [Pararhodobacter zhoushanensis]